MVDKDSGLLVIIIVDLPFPLQVIDDIQVAHRPGVPGSIGPGTQRRSHSITGGNVPN